MLHCGLITYIGGGEDSQLTSKLILENCMHQLKKKKYHKKSSGLSDIFQIMYYRIV